MSKSKPYSVELTTRTVIEGKLLVSLQEGGMVAILASKQDLEDMIAALREFRLRKPFLERFDRCQDLASGMEQLLKEAFDAP